MSRRRRHKECETSYVAVVGPETLWPGPKGREFPGMQKISSTILVVETADLGISWMEPRDLPFAAAVKGVTSRPRSGIACRHPCGGGDERFEGVYSGWKPEALGYSLFGANCLFAHGGVLTVSERCPPQLIAQLLQVAGGQPERGGETGGSVKYQSQKGSREPRTSRGVR